MAVSNIHEYWDEQQTRLEQLHSVSIDHEHTYLDEFPDGRGQVRSHLLLVDDHSYVVLVELLRLDGYVRREAYNYHLMLGGKPAGRWDFDPALDPVNAYHINPASGDQHLIPFERITLPRVLECSWEAFSQWHDSGKQSLPDIVQVTYSVLNMAPQNAKTKQNRP